MDATTRPRPASPRELRDFQAYIDRFGVRSLYVPPKASSQEIVGWRALLESIATSPAQ